MKAFERKHGPAYRLLGQRLREARDAVGLSQVEAAANLGVPQSFISKCESGERRVDIIELKVMAQLYKKDLAFFDVVS